MEAAILTLVSVVVNWTINFVKDITNKNWNGVITRISALGAAVMSVSVYAHQTIPILNSIDLSKLNGGAQLALAYALAASGGTITDLFRTLNRADPNVQPKLVPGLKDAA